jgi:Protein of unknown function (DUF3592)
LIDKLFGALFFGVGTAFSFYTLLQFWRTYRSLTWPVLEAEVVANSVKEHRGRGGGYEPVVRYRYGREGRIYEGGTIVFSSISVIGTRKEAEEFLKQLPVGARIPVRVCPAKSQLSVIKPGFERPWWIPLVFSILLIIVGYSAWSNP